jgi:hypothetical protein
MPTKLGRGAAEAYLAGLGGGSGSRLAALGRHGPAHWSAGARAETLAASQKSRAAKFAAGTDRAERDRARARAERRHVGNRGLWGQGGAAIGRGEDSFWAAPAVEKGSVVWEAADLIGDACDRASAAGGGESGRRIGGGRAGDERGRNMWVGGQWAWFYWRWVGW